MELIIDDCEVDDEFTDELMMVLDSSMNQAVSGQSRSAKKVFFEMEGWLSDKYGV